MPPVHGQNRDTLMIADRLIADRRTVIVLIRLATTKSALGQAVGIKRSSSGRSGARNRRAGKSLRVVLAERPLEYLNYEPTGLADAQAE
jgi:hypothetical protein